MCMVRGFLPLEEMNMEKYTYKPIPPGSEDNDYWGVVIDKNDTEESPSAHDYKIVAWVETEDRVHQMGPLLLLLCHYVDEVYGEE